MVATVLKLTLNRVCEARTANDILFVFPVPTGVILKPADRLDLGEPVLAGVLHVVNLTRGGAFESTIKENDVHDLRVPVRHGSSRTPTIERLNGP
jgi:hypothetical protein